MDLATLADRIELDDLVTGYALAIDSGDLDALDVLSTRDAIYDYTSVSGPIGAVRDVVPWLARSFAAVPQRAHLIVNRRVEIAGDAAAVRAYFFNPMVIKEKGRSAWMPGGGDYTVAARRTSAGWRISSLVMNEVWRVLADGSVLLPKP